MCGIFIIVSFAKWLTLRSVGETPIEKGIFLEYRGSQSVGLAIKVPNEDPFIRKVLRESEEAPQKSNKVVHTSERLLPFLQERCDSAGELQPSPMIGMIHTRWPTSGGVPDIIKAQPMLSEEGGEFTIVLNGMIANADELRAEIVNNINAAKLRAEILENARLRIELEENAKLRAEIVKNAKLRAESVKNANADELRALILENAKLRARSVKNANADKLRAEIIKNAKLRAGIEENANADELSDEIKKNSIYGKELKTNTDTEVVVRLFYEIYHRNREGIRSGSGESPLAFEAICKQVTDRCKGKYAISVTSDHFPEEIVAYANKMMLCLGFGDENAEFRSTGEEDCYSCQKSDYFEFSSDPRILTASVKRYFKLERCDIVKISRDGILLDRNTDPAGEICYETEGFEAQDQQDQDGGEEDYYEVWDIGEQQAGDASAQPASGCGKLTRKGEPVIHEYKYEKIEVDLKEGVMLREIESQETYLAGIIEKSLKDGEIVFEELGRIMSNTLAQRKRFYFVGCGSSYNVGLSVKQAFTDFVGAEICEVLNAVMLVDQRHQVVARDSVYIFISQSGTTGDTNQALEYCRARGALCIAVTNTRPSLICDDCHATIDVMAGFERAIASTKAYTCQYLQLCLLAAFLGERRLKMYKMAMDKERENGRHAYTNGIARGDEVSHVAGSRENPVARNGKPRVRKGSLPYPLYSLSDETVKRMTEGLDSFTTEVRAFAGKVKEALNCEIDELVKYTAKSENMCLFLLSRGVEYATAVEAGLKVSEVTQINTRVLYSSELMHGPLASIHEHARVIMIEPSDPTVQMKLRGAVDQVLTTGAAPFIICTSTTNLEYYKQKNVCCVMMLPETHYLLQGIITAISFQRSCHFTCGEIGKSSDLLPNLAKSITVTH